MENYSDYDFIYKIVLVGDTSVGKTNIFSKYLNDKFEKNSQKTIGGVFGSKTIEIKKKKIKIQIWDITGQEIYTEIAKPFYNGALGALLVYDISQKITIKNIEKRINDLRIYGNKNISIILIGNKSDLNNKREISEEEGLKLSEKYNINFIETSALNGYNINEAFYNLIENIYDNSYINNIEDSEQFIDNSPPTAKNENEKICFSCTECSSAIELLKIDEKNNSMDFKCLNKKSHGIKNISIKAYFQKMKENKQSNINEYNVKCKDHIDKNFTHFCLDCNVHLCRDCLGSRIHLDHRKNDIIEMKPCEEELNIIDKVIKYYKNELNNLKIEKKKKTEELKNILIKDETTEEKLLNQKMIINDNNKKI